MFIRQRSPLDQISDPQLLTIPLSARKYLDCLQYLAGAYDMLVSVGLDEYGICPPRMNNDQLVRVVLKWLRDHPERLHEFASVGIFWSLATSFPCEPTDAHSILPKAKPRPTRR
jgi:hypothetical protein